MKKTKLVAIIICVALVALTLSFALTACNTNQADDPNTIVVGASAYPHAEILRSIESKLNEKGYKLVVKVFEDYVTPNTALDEGSLNANYFQHTPYLETFNKDYKTDLVAVAKVHYEPFCVYGKGVTKEQFLSQKTGRTILIPNDGSNLTRALLVLRDEGYITLPDDASAERNLTVQDIVSTNGNTIRDIEASTLTIQLGESDNGTIAVINGNYAIEANYDLNDALAIEKASGSAAQLYANVIAVKRGHENDPKTLALKEALLTQEVKDFISSTYKNAVIPVF